MTLRQQVTSPSRLPISCSFLMLQLHINSILSKLGHYHINTDVDKLRHSPSPNLIPSKTLQGCNMTKPTATSPGRTLRLKLLNLYENLMIFGHMKRFTRSRSWQSSRPMHETPTSTAWFLPSWHTADAHTYAQFAPP